MRSSYWTVNRLQPDEGYLLQEDGHLVEESTMTIYVNAQEIATLMCSPLELDTLALGFLYNEGVIASIDDVRFIATNAAESAVDVYLQRIEFAQPRRMILTSGCGGGSASQVLIDSFPPLETTFTTTPENLFERMEDLYQVADLYQHSGGIHTSILCTPDAVLHSAEDIGRHNTIDRLAGEMLRNTAGPRPTMLLASGRISSEMLTKARRMAIPLVASRTSPTSMAVRYAQAWNICLVGYVRRHRLRIYAHPERLGITIAAEPAPAGRNGKTH